MALDVPKPKNAPRKAWRGGRNLKKEPITAEEWNTLYKPGREVIVLLDSGEMRRTTTCSEAWNLGHGQPVVKLDGISGGYDLRRVMPA